jgi:hypothetical protein
MNMNHPITEARELETPKIANDAEQSHRAVIRGNVGVVKGLLAWRLEFSPQT